MATRPRSRTSSYLGPLWPLVEHDFVQAAQSLRGLGPLIGGASGPTQRVELETMIVGLANAMTRMVDVMSDISALEAGQLATPAAGVALKGIVDSTCGLLSPVAAERKLTLTATAAPCRIAVPPAIARSAVLGLAISALRLARRGEVRIEATARSCAEIIATFNGINPAPSLTRTGFVQLPALPAAAEEPFLAPGPALLSRIASATGGRLYATASSASEHALTLEFPLKSA